ncbi:MAG: hypothetical protein ACK2T3_01290, partial [Candidatus Promineifilaceae bacterium]
LILLLRFAILYLIGERGIGRYLQSVTIGVGLILVGVLVGLFGIQADIASKHRLLTQEALYRLKKMEMENFRRELPNQNREPDEKGGEQPNQTTD